MTPSCPAADALRRFLRGELGQAEAAVVDVHLSACPDCERVVAALADEPIRPAGPEERVELPGFDVRGVLGRGGMGVVYRIYDRRLRREMALKTVRIKFASDERARGRFQEEMFITAQLQHPGVAPVHDTGTLPDGRPYYLMKVVKGQTLSELLAARKTLGEDLPRFLDVFQKVCQPVAYAHSHGLIHRDLKPDNVMVGAFGEVQVVDWGLARKVGGGERALPKAETEAKPSTNFDTPRDNDGGRWTERAVGTFAYMAPEQAAEPPGEVDTRSDVFGLGAILCEILTGQPPYPAKSRDAAKAMAVLGATDAAVARLDKCTGDPDMVILCKQCLASDPARRPPDATAVEATVTELLAAAEERARRAVLDYQAAEVRATEGRKRRRVATGLGVVIGVLFLALGAGGWWTDRQHFYAEQRQERLETDLRQTTAVKEVNRRNLYASHLTAVQRAWEDHSLVVFRDLLDRWRQVGPNEADLRGFEWRYWERLRGSHLWLLRPLGQLYTVAYAPDGGRLAAAGEDRLVRVWSTPPEGGAPIGPPLLLRGHADRVWQVAFSGDGNRLASASKDGTVKIWDAAAGDLRFNLEGNGEASCVAFSPDGTVLAAGTGTTARVWRAGNGQVLRDLRGHSDRVRTMAFHPDGRRLVTGGYDGHVKLWDVSSGDCLREWRTGRNQILGVAINPGGTLVAAGGTDHRVWLWDLSTGAPLPYLSGHTDDVKAVTFSPDGRLASADGRGQVVLWTDLAKNVGRVYQGHDGKVMGIAFHPGGRQLATASLDESLRIWDATKPQQGREFKGHTRDVQYVAFHPSGGTFASGGDDMKILLWDVSGGPPRPLTGHTGAVHGIAFSPDRALLASAGADRTVRLWDIPSGGPGRILDHEAPVRAVAFSPDGRRLASATENGVVKLWDAETGQSLNTLPHPGIVHGVAFSPDGTRLASVGSDKCVRIWDATDGALVFTLVSHRWTVRGVAFATDGTRLATCGEDWTVRLWDLRTGQEVLILKRARGHLYGVAFSPDGQQVVSGGGILPGEEQVVHLWEAPSSQDDPAR